MTDRETIDVYDARAQDYADLVDSSEPDARLSDLLERLPRAARLLDLGCGPGNAARHMAAAGHDVLAWDASAEMVALARAHAGVTAEHKTFAALQDLAPQNLDGVWANFSLLHAPRADVRRHFDEIAAALRPGGHFLFATKDGTGAERDSIGRLYTYFTEAEIRSWLAETGFTVLRADYGNEPGLSGEEADWFSLTAQKT